jgi:hypothetical protein
MTRSITPYIPSLNPQPEPPGILLNPQPEPPGIRFHLPLCLLPAPLVRR